MPLPCPFFGMFQSGTRPAPARRPPGRHRPDHPGGRENLYHPNQQPPGKNSLTGRSISLNGTEKMPASPRPAGCPRFGKACSRSTRSWGRREFLYIDRGCIVNLIHVMQIKDGMAVLKNGVALPISRSHLQAVKAEINRYWGEHIDRRPPLPLLRRSRMGADYPGPASGVAAAVLPAAWTGQPWAGPWRGCGSRPAAPFLFPAGLLWGGAGDGLAGALRQPAPRCTPSHGPVRGDLL